MNLKRNKKKEKEIRMVGMTEWNQQENVLLEEFLQNFSHTFIVSIEQHFNPFWYRFQGVFIHT